MLIKTSSDSTGTSLQNMHTAESHDFIVRLSKDVTSTTWGMQVASVDASGIYLLLRSKYQETELLKDIVNWQHKLLDYNSHYCAFLLGQIDEDEFGNIAEGFSYETKDMSPESLTPLIDQIYKLTEIEYTASELAGFFECRTENVVQAIKPLALANKRLNDMLPIPATE